MKIILDIKSEKGLWEFLAGSFCNNENIVHTEYLDYDIEARFKGEIINYEWDDEEGVDKLKIEYQGICVFNEIDGCDDWDEKMDKALRIIKCLGEKQ